MKTVRAKIAVSVLIAVNIASALGLVYTTHLVRQSTAELQHLRSESYNLDAQYGRLLLESSALGGHARIDSLAAEMGMVEPDENQVVIVEVKP